jgi:type I restriction enzyme S subunit
MSIIHMSGNKHQTKEVEFRRYNRSESVVFLKTKERFGELSNMAAGFPVLVNGSRANTVEAVYQACRFPHRPDLQELIFAQNSPMTAKMKVKPFRSISRSDWNNVRIRCMRWSLQLKLAYNFAEFSRILKDTGNKPIVELSTKDRFWGAEPIDDNTLVGANVLGRLLMQLRNDVIEHPENHHRIVDPPAIDEFLFFGRATERAITRTGIVEGRHAIASEG